MLVTLNIPVLYLGTNCHSCFSPASLSVNTAEPEITLWVKKNKNHVSKLSPENGSLNNRQGNPLSVTSTHKQGI